MTNPTVHQAIVLLPFVIPVAIWVAWTDLKEMKIRNKAVIAMTAIWALVGWYAVGWESWLWGFAIMAIVLALGFFGNMIGLFGAGDAKFAAAMAGVFVGGSPWFIAGLYAVCSIGALVLHRILKRIPAVRRATPDWTSWERKKLFPMGLSLSSMLVIYLLAAFLPQG
ncbi:A24 family peptidase [Pseudogemmobacter sonorensis]|uniref:A24 family peptidase n=1 Tax=Pseudogemmobacter sonorensis TaxID=2989681 RepID=UPI0036BF8716